MKKINPQTFNALKTTREVVATRVKPEDEDYNRGFYMRFFVKKHNLENSYMEIDAETYHKLVNKNPQYDYRLYKTGNIEWSLRGDAEKTNTLQLKRLEKDFPLLYVLFPILNEFQATTAVVRTETPTFNYQYGGVTQVTSGTSGGGSGY